MSRRIKQIFKNQYISAVFLRLMAILLALAVSSVKARVLGEALNGQYAYIHSWVATLAIVASVGIYQAYPYFRKQDGPAFQKKYAGAIQLMFLVYAAIAIVLMLVIKEENFRIIALLLPIFVTSKNISYMVLVEKPQYRNVIEAAVYIIDILVLTVSYFTKWINIYTVALTIVVKEIVKIIIFSVINRQKIEINKETGHALKELITFGAFPMLAALMTYMNYRVDVFMLERYVPYELIGIYSVGSSLAEQLWIIPEAVRDILLSKLAKGKKAEEVAKVSKYSFYIVLLCTIAMLVFGKAIIVIIYGAAYESSYEVAILEIFGVIGMVYVKMIAAYNLVVAKQKTSLLILTIGVVLNVVLNLLLIPDYSIRGAALATMISYSAMGIMFAGGFIKSTDVRLKDFFNLDINRLRNRNNHKEK